MGIEAWVRDTTQKACLPVDNEPELFSWYVEEFANGDPDVQVAMSTLVNGANAAGFLPRVRVAVLGLYPSGGQITSDAQVEMLKDGLANFEIHHLPTEYHMTQLLYPEEYARFLDEFCSQHGM